MRSVIVPILFCLGSFTTCAQRAQRVMIAAHADLIKSDNDGFFEKVQGGIEGSFYVSRKFAATGGLDWWSGPGTSAVVGMRFSPIDEAFIIIRGLLQKDFSIGGGFHKPLPNNFRIEAMGDFYFEGYIAIRAGIAYGIGPRP
jgi:hypothetical protein